MIRLLAILLLAAMPVFAQTTTETAAQGKRGLTESNVGQYSGSWNVPTGATEVMRIVGSDANAPMVISNYDRTIIIRGMTCTRHSTVQAETICTPNKEVRQ